MNSRYEILNNQFELIEAIRTFFKENGFKDVLTPPAVENPGMETHIHPFRLYSEIDKKRRDLWLHTSPEFHMKELLSLGFDKIFTMSYCFRDEPSSSTHRHQFIMLEWYRANSFYTDIMDDVENLIDYCVKALNIKNYDIQIKRMTVQEVFNHFLQIDILDYLEKEKLKRLILEQFPDVPLQKSDDFSWDDYYFLLFLNKIEPRLNEIPGLLLYEFPHHLSALSTISKNDPRVCDRFEVYLNGVEICNCFNELEDLIVQKERFEIQHKEKKSLYGYELQEPKVLYNSLEKGINRASGIALGVERLLMAISKNEEVFWD